MKSEPCAKLTIRVTPKISDRPADTRNKDEAAASPFRSWMRMLAKVTSRWGRATAAHSHAPEVARSSLAARHDAPLEWRAPSNQLAGLIFLISASDGSASLPSTKRHSFI